MKHSTIQVLIAAAFGAALLIAPAANAETRTFSAGHKLRGFHDSGTANAFYRERRKNFALKRSSVYKQGGFSKRVRIRRFDIRRGTRFEGGGR